MSKICSSCGNELADDAKFCNKCGTSTEMTEGVQETVNSNQTSSTGTNVNEIVEKVKKGFSSFVEKLKNDKKTLGITVGAVVGVIVLVILFSVLMPSSKKLLKDYCSGMQNMNAKKVVKTFYPDYMEKMKEYLDEDFEDMLSDRFDDLKDEDYKYLSYEIDNDYDKYDKDELEELAEDMEDTFDIDEKDVKEAREYRVKFKVKDDGDKKTEKEDIVVVKIKSKWYVFAGV